MATLHVYLPLLLLLIISIDIATSWLISSSLKPRSTLKQITMRDGSAADTFINVDDYVRVVADVPHYPPGRDKFSSLNKIGRVVSVWVKCEVDPHCCCAELAFDAPIEVQFENDDSYYGDALKSWTGHFSLDEIEMVERSQR